MRKRSSLPDTPPSDSAIQLGRAIEGDGHYKAKGFEWMLMCPHLGSSDKICLMLLCGLAREGHQRNLTLEEIGDFLTSSPVEVGETPKRMSVSGVAKVLNRLSALGQLTDPGGNPIKVSNRMTSVLRLIPYRFPRHTCGASRNVYDALARIRGEEPMWDLATDDASESKITKRRVYKKGRPSGDAHKSVPDAQNSVPRAHKSVQDRPLTSENGPFLRSSLGSSSLFEGAPEDAPSDSPTPEAPSEEDEEMKNFNDTPSTESRGDLPQEREGEEEIHSHTETPHKPVTASVDVPAFIASLPGLSGLQAASCAVLEGPVADALAAGWTERTLREHLKPKIDPVKAKSPSAVPGWYVRHLAELPEPPKAVIPLCENPAHAREPMPDPVNGGCLPCNTFAARGPLTVTALEAKDVVEADGDAVDAGAVLREAIKRKRFAPDSRSKKQTARQRAADEAEINLAKANDLLHGTV